MKKYFLLFIISFLIISNADASAGIIDTSVSNQAKVCHDTTCASPAPGIINFELVSEPSITVNSVTGLSGKVWGNELGWINMNPTGSGVVFDNPTTGLLAGKAWSQVSGWINFAVTGQSVTINPSTGEFAGWAWAGGPYGGWIKFDCSDVSSCVKTTWRPTVSSSGGGRPIDICPNLSGAERTLPPGYTIDQSGNCILVAPDVCPNLSGDQTSIPSGYTKDSLGACVPNKLDYCSNLPGKQSFIPSGYFVDSSGKCILNPKDFCPMIPGIQSSYKECGENTLDYCSNLPGIQAVVPSQFNAKEGICLPVEYDACPNIAGVQSGIPSGYNINTKGECYAQELDVCNNLAGSQPKAPRGFEVQGTECVYVGSTEESNITVVALNIVPEFIQLPSDNHFIKKVVEKTKKTFGVESPAEPYKVDLVSSGVSLLGILVLLAFIARILML